MLLLHTMERCPGPGLCPADSRRCLGDWLTWVFIGNPQGSGCLLSSRKRCQTMGSHLWGDARTAGW